MKQLSKFMMKGVLSCDHIETCAASPSVKKRMNFQWNQSIMFLGERLILGRGFVFQLIIFENNLIEPAGEMCVLFKIDFVQ